VLEQAVKTVTEFILRASEAVVILR